MKKLVSLVVVLAIASLASALTPGVVMDSQGFEGYNIGTINGQNAGYWNPGGTGSKNWSVYTGPEETAQIKDIGGARGKVLSIEPGWATNAGGGFGLQAHMEWNTPGVDGGYWGIPDNGIVIEFDVLIEGGTDNPWPLAVVDTYRNSKQVLQSSTAMGAWNAENQVDFVSQIRTLPNETGVTGWDYPAWKDLVTTTESAWHSVKITQTLAWVEGLQDIKIQVDGALVGAGKGIWNGWPGCISAINIWGYNVENWIAGDTQMYFDNIKVSYIPEPATMSLLALGVLGMLRRRK